MGTTQGGERKGVRGGEHRRGRAAVPVVLLALLVMFGGAFLALSLSACGTDASETETGDSWSAPNADDVETIGDVSVITMGKTQKFTPKDPTAATLVIASGSENKEAKSAIAIACAQSGVTVEMHYMGSVDIKNLLASGADGYDAVWPASSIWISMGDTQHLVKDTQSTSTTPVILGMAKSMATELGWYTPGQTTSVPTADIVRAVQSGKLAFSMTSATQSNSGASAYLAFLTALAGKDTPLTADDLESATLQDSMRDLLSGVDRSSGSSDWLKEMVVANPDQHRAMINYESLVIAANKELTEAGADPLVAVYPADGIAVSDSPLGYIDRGQGNEEVFSKFQEALATDDAKLELERAGRRTGLGGKLAHADDAQVQAAFDPDWGITEDASVLRTAPMPAADVMTQALNLYQSTLRKPAYTIWVVDYSGSMEGAGKEGVTEGLRLALDPAEATRYMIQPSDYDLNVFVPFNHSVIDTEFATGADTQDLLALAEDTSATGGTNMYIGLEAALQYLPKDEDAFTVAIILMTDGQSDVDDKDDFMRQYQELGRDVPIFPIMFGMADSSQLEPLAQMSDGKVFDGRSGDLAQTFREVKGYN